ncbi:hypothetical protein G6F32_016835 [Rhizopus arrhizus]|nr:hypothetical protein G6F32_016835 [Rhizopus arrhizus]
MRPPGSAHCPAWLTRRGDCEPAQPEMRRCAALTAGTAPPPATQSAAPMAAARSTAASTVGNAACSCARTWPALLTATAA